MKTKNKKHDQNIYNSVKNGSEKNKNKKQNKNKTKQNKNKNTLRFVKIAT